MKDAQDADQEVEATTRAAQDLLQPQINVITKLAELQARRKPVQKQLAQIDAEYARAWAEALGLGWSVRQLKQLVMPEPESRAPGRPRGSQGRGQRARTARPERTQPQANGGTPAAGRADTASNAAGDSQAARAGRDAGQQHRAGGTARPEPDGVTRGGAAVDDGTAAGRGPG